MLTLSLTSIQRHLVWTQMICLVSKISERELKSSYPSLQLFNSKQNKITNESYLFQISDNVILLIHVSSGTCHLIIEYLLEMLYEISLNLRLICCQLQNLQFNFTCISLHSNTLMFKSDLNKYKSRHHNLPLSLIPSMSQHPLISLAIFTLSYRVRHYPSKYDISIILEDIKRYL